MSSMGNSPTTEGQNSFRACPKGKSSDEDIVCWLCPGGKYSDEKGIECKKCDAGKYSEIGSTSCKNCAAGKFSYEGANGAECQDCSQGWFSLDGGLGCERCEAGKVSATGSTVCSFCPLVRDGNKVKVGPGALSEDSTCPAGYTPVATLFQDTAPVREHAPSPWYSPSSLKPHPFEVHHKECDMHGCRAQLTAGEAELVARCMPTTIGGGHGQDYVDGDTVTAAKDELSEYSQCPVGYSAIGLSYLKMELGTISQLNLRECSMTGCRVWPRGQQATFRTRCVMNNAGAFDEGTLVEVEDGVLSNFSSCPPGSRGLGLAFVDLLGGVESTVVQEVCGSEKVGVYGCQALVKGGDAVIRTRCWKPNTNECDLSVEYAKGSHGEDTCPDGYHHITDYSVCQNACQRLSLPYNGEAKDHGTDYPAGCFIDTGSNDDDYGSGCMLNTGAGGAAPSARPVCVVGGNGTVSRLVVDGCSDLGEDVPESCELSASESSTEAAVRCCSTSGDECVSEAGPGQCLPGAASYETAAQTCTALGMRICTKTQLNSGLCCDTGCGFDSKAVWASTSCRQTAAPTAAPTPAPPLFALLAATTRENGNPPGWQEISEIKLFNEAGEDISGTAQVTFNGCTKPNTILTDGIIANAPADSGAPTANPCQPLWMLASPGQSCTDACDAVGRTCDLEKMKSTAASRTTDHAAFSAEVDGLTCYRTTNSGADTSMFPFFYGDADNADCRLYHDSSGHESSVTCAAASDSEGTQNPKTRICACGGLVSVSFKSGGESGMLHDTGAAFGTQGDFEYGWLCDDDPKDQSAGVRSWGNHFDRNDDCWSGTTSWQMTVPNGAYDIKVTLPRESKAGCKVQGKSTGGSYGNFVYEQSITVTDGRLTLSGDFPTCHSIESFTLEPTGSQCTAPESNSRKLLASTEGGTEGGAACVDDYDLGTVAKPWGDFVSCEAEKAHCMEDVHITTLQQHCMKTCDTCPPAYDPSVQMCQWTGYQQFKDKRLVTFSFSSPQTIVAAEVYTTQEMAMGIDPVLQTSADGTTWSNVLSTEAGQGLTVIYTNETRWTECASEGEQCTFVGEKNVRYGANAVFTEKLLSGGTSCSNSVFGDPIIGVGKTCAYEAAWTRCASEGGQCSFSGVRTVRYGENGVFTEKELKDGTACNNGVFGDPLVGVGKVCDIEPAMQRYPLGGNTATNGVEITGL